MKPRDLLDLVILAMLWGGSFLFMRICAPAFGPVALIEWRVLIAALFLLPLLLARDGRQGLAHLHRHAGSLLLMGVGNSALPFVLFAFAILSITSGLAAVMNATAPLFAAVIGWLWLNERLRLPQVAGLLLGLAGVATLVWDKLSWAPAGAVPMSDVPGRAPGGAALAIVAALAAGAAYGWAANYTRLRLAELPPLVVATGSQIGAALALAPFAWFMQPAAPPSPAAWLGVLALGIGCTGLAYILFFRLINRAGVTRAISVTFLVPVFGVLWGALFLGEQVTWSMVGGALVVLAGTALVTRR